MRSFLYKVIYYIFILLSFHSCFANECVEDPTISSYVKDLYIEGADQSQTYYIRQIRRNVKGTNGIGTWLVSIGAAKTIEEDNADGSSQVLVYSLGKNIENENVLTLTPINGFKGYGYISLDWSKIPVEKEILCRAKINSNGFQLKRGGEIKNYIDSKFAAYKKSSQHSRFDKLENSKSKGRDVVKNNAEYVIKVKNQSDFDNLNEALKSALRNSNKNILVDIADGNYTFKDSHIELKNINDPNVSIAFKGAGSAMLIGANSIVAKKNSLFDDSHAYLTTNLENRDLWSDAKQMKDTIQVVDLKSKLCRFKSVEPISNQLNPKCLIKITEWFKVLVYRALKFEDGYIYFYAPELSYTAWLKCYNVNQDFKYGQKFPRYRLFHETNSAVEPLLDCTSSQFLNVENCKIKRISIENIKFKGNSLNKPSLISFNNVESYDSRISNCQFSAIRGIVINILNSQNVTLEGNQIKDCYMDCFVADNKSVGFVAKGNSFVNNGLFMNNSACIIARGKDFVVSENSFCDFSYAAISVGMNYQWKKDAVCSGIVEDNEIHYSSEYFYHPEKYTLMDGGAIYVMTQLDDVIIRYNRIYDYRGVAANRGIFCDDGTKNISLYGNVITNVPNSFSIDLRLCPEVANRVPDHNRNIMMMYNVMDVKYRFQGVDKSSACLGPNFIVSRQNNSKFDNLISNVSSFEDDYYLEGYTDFGAKSINLQNNSRNFILQGPIRAFAKRYVKRK